MLLSSAREEREEERRLRGGTGWVGTYRNYNNRSLLGGKGRVPFDVVVRVVYRLERDELMLRLVNDLRRYCLEIVSVCLGRWCRVGRGCCRAGKLHQLVRGCSASSGVECQRFVISGQESAKQSATKGAAVPRQWRIANARMEREE